ncbi:MAG: 50S ribosome-binding GTPase [Acidimicrobiia bacterium]|nr:50S ribosome-binding GTPase [Acidimicrobiia bacterium]
MTDHAPSPERLAAVAAALERIDLALAGPEPVALRDATHRVVTDYLIPRTAHPDDDLVVAIVGVSGAGKSTLINSIARRRLTETGTRRPTTLEPVAWGHGALPATLDAARRRLPGRMVDTLRPPPDGVVIVDTPPPDVVDAAGTPVCDQILDVADACIVVAGAARYADAAGFDLAARAARRGVATSFVLNRLPPVAELQRVLVADYAAKLARAGLIERPEPGAVIAIAEGVVVPEREGLAMEAVMGFRKEVERLADPQERARVAAFAVGGTTRLVAAALATLRGALIAAESRRVQLADPIALSYADATDRVVAAVRSGAFAELKDDPDELAAALAAATARRAGRAALQSAASWESARAGTSKLLFTHGAETPAAARDRIRWWHDDILRLAGELGGRPGRGRRAARLVRATRAAVIDPAHVFDRKERRVIGRNPGLVAAAADRLADELAGIVAADSARFTARLGAGTPWGVLAQLTLEESM